MLGIEWLAGLLEGEGSFHTSINRAGARPRISVAMTDKDVMERVARELETKVLGPYPHGPDGKYQPMYNVAVAGKRALGVMLTLYPEMGQRRRQQIKAVLSYWEHSGKEADVL